MNTRILPWVALMLPLFLSVSSRGEENTVEEENPVALPSAENTKKPTPANPSLMAKAYQSLRTGQYGQAIQLYDKVYWTDPWNYNDALFFIIYCQHKLEQYGKVIGNLAYLDRTKLSAPKIRTLDHLLKDPAYEVKTTWVSASGSGGLISFPGSSYNGSGFFSGGLASVIFDNHKIAASFDRVFFSRIGTTPISQNQYTLFYGNTFADHWAIQANLALIDSSDSDTNSGKNAGILLKYFSWNGFYVSLESFLTLYPIYTASNLVSTLSPLSPLSPMTVGQSSLGVGFPLWGSDSSGFYIDLKGTFIRPIQASQSSENFSNQNYSSGQLGFRYYTGGWSLAASGSYGRQVYAVQNGGQTIVNSPFIRTGSARISLTYSFSRQAGLTLMGGGDQIEEPQGSTYLLLSGLSLGVTF